MRIAGSMIKNETTAIARVVAVTFTDYCCCYKNMLMKEILLYLEAQIHGEGFMVWNWLINDWIYAWNSRRILRKNMNSVARWHSEGEIVSSQLSMINAALRLLAEVLGLCCYEDSYQRLIVACTCLRLEIALFSSSVLYRTSNISSRLNK